MGGQEVRAVVASLVIGCVSGGGETLPVDARAETADATAPDTASDTATPPKSDALIFEVDDPDACPGTLCGSECVDLAGDPNHCSACGMRCGDNQYCRLGAGPVCKCRPPAVACSGNCVDRNSDPTGCGECGVVCPFACAKGACVLACPAGLRGCPFMGKQACVDVMKDPANCGACGVICDHDEVCAAGKCARYRPGPGCASCPCSLCASSTPASTCCPPLPGQPSVICVAGLMCP